MPAYKLIIHLSGGGSVSTLVEGEELEANDYDPDDIDGFVDDLLNPPNGKPRWVSIGDIKFHPQGINAIVLDEIGD